MKKAYKLVSFAMILAVSAACTALVGCGGASTASSAVSQGASVSVAESTETTSSDAANQTEQVFPEACGAAETTALEERTGRDAFKSIDEIISLLQTGEGYARLKVAGKDDEVLAVASMTYAWDENTNAAIDVDFYGVCGYLDGDERVIHIGTIHTGGTAYPVRLSDEGILYACNNRIFGELEFDISDLLEYATKINIEYNTDGSYTISGYKSTDGTLSNLTADIGVNTEDDFNALFDGLDEIPIINFTKVE